MAAGLVDRVQVTIFPVISGRTGTEPIFGGAADFDLEMLDHHALSILLLETLGLLRRPGGHLGLREGSGPGRSAGVAFRSAVIGALAPVRTLFQFAVGNL